MPSLTLRPALDGDRTRMFDCFARTMQAVITATWGWDEAFQRGSFDSDVRTADCQVFEKADEFAGFAAVERAPEAWIVQMLCLEPAHQARGHGGHWLRGLLREAGRAQKPVRLWVIRSSPARRLYERLGFKIVAEDPQVFEMVALP